VKFLIELSRRRTANQSFAELCLTLDRSLSASESNSLSGLKCKMLLQIIIKKNPNCLESLPRTRDGVVSNKVTNLFKKPGSTTMIRSLTGMVMLTKE